MTRSASLHDSVFLPLQPGRIEEELLAKEALDQDVGLNLLQLLSSQAAVAEEEDLLAGCAASRRVGSGRLPARVSRRCGLVGSL